MKPLTKDTALEFLHEKMKNQNLRRHCYAVGMVLRAYHDYFSTIERNLPGLTAQDWEIAGLLHDSDYEATKDDPTKHTQVLLDWLKEYEVREEILDVFRSHNSKITGLRSPQTLLEWTLECCDELTGFIVATALILPSKKLADVTLEGVLKRLDQPAFARAVDRSQITQCETRLQIPVEKFVDIALKAMQKNHEVLGL